MQNQTSELKSQTARINGAKSKGPITPEGRAKSSRNSTRHGLSSKVTVMPAENPEEFQALLDAHIDRFQPHDLVEMSLVEALASTRWRLTRIAIMEAGLYTIELERQRDVHDLFYKPESLDYRCADIFKHLAATGPSLTQLLRYETTLNRNYDRTLKQLAEMQANRKPETEEQQIEPRTPNAPHTTGHSQNEPTDEIQPEIQHLPPECAPTDIMAVA